MSEEISPLEDHGWWMERLRKDAKANRPEALRLADALDVGEISYTGMCKAAAELRRLHALNGELLEALKHHQEQTRPIERTRAAIARAEGKV
jgi:hypothetical protein